MSVSQNNIPIKNLWINRCIDVYKFHVRQCKDEPNWTLRKTAEFLNRSLGSVSEDILIATWLATHEAQIRKFKYMTDALDFIKKKKRERFLAGG